MDALLRAWEETRTRRANRVAIFGANGEPLRTFDEIQRDAERFANSAELRVLQLQHVVALQTGNHRDWPALLLACLMRELVVLPLDASMSETERGTASEICHARLRITAAPDGAIAFEDLRADPVDWGEQPPSLLKLTSGTTAAPRAIRFRSAQLVADAEQICDSMGITDHDVNLAMVPMSHSYGLNNLVTPLLVRGVACALAHDRMPRALLAALAATSATVFPGTPILFSALADVAAATPTLRLCVSAGAPLSLEVARKFRERFGQPIHSFYGASECGGICYDAEGVSDVAAFVGTPMRGVSVELVGDAGQIRVRSAAVAEDYFPNPDAAKLGDGAFHPDDLLEISGAGFRIMGRASDIINVAGKKVNPAEIEAHLRQCPGVRDAVVFGRASTQRNEEVIACVAAATSGLNEADVLAFLRTRLSSWQVPKRAFFVDALPVNERGKISRRELAERFG